MGIIMFMMQLARCCLFVPPSQPPGLDPQRRRNGVRLGPTRLLPLLSVVTRTCCVAANSIGSITLADLALRVRFFTKMTPKGPFPVLRYTKVSGRFHPCNYFVSVWHLRY